MASDKFRALSDAFTKNRKSFLAPFEVWARRLLPSDWLVIFLLGSALFFSAFALISAVSLSVAVEVPARGGTYTEGLIGSPRFVNPILALSETDRDLVALIYSGLMKANSDGTLSPDIAESYRLSEDNLTYTFTIRDDALFHDGQAVTAEDVAFSVRMAQSAEIKSPRRANWEGVTAVVLDAKTISFTLKTPYAPFLENTTLGILPQTLWRGVSPDEFPFSALNTKPVGSGPYRLHSVKQNNSGIPVEYRLKAFSRGVRVPFIDQFVFRFYQNTDALKVALNQGEISAAHSLDPAEVAAPIVLNEAAFGRIFGVFFNQNQNDIFLEEAVRRALDTALDKQAIIDTVIGSYGSVIDGPLPLESTREDGSVVVSAEERIGDAKTMLESAGWKRNEEGIFEKKVKKETKRLSFSLATSNAPELKETAEMVARTWRALGAEVELQFFEQTDLNTEVLRPRKYDALLFGLVIGHDLDLFAFWHSSQRNDPGLNIALYASIDADKQLEQARTEYDTELRREKAVAAAKIIEDEQAAVFIYTPHFLYLIPKDIRGITLGTIVTPSDRFASVEEWYMRSARVWPFFSNTKYSFKNTSNN